MVIKDILKDVLKHTHGLGIFEMVKITGEVDKTNIETVDADKTVIFKGETLNPVPEFVDSTVGLSRMGVLQGYLQYPGFDEDGSNVSVVTQERNGEDVPVEVEFTAKDGNNANYRFMLADVINNDIDGSITGDWRWPLDIVLRILKLSDSGNCVMSFNNQGLLQIVVDSGLAKYTYLLPAKS